MNKTELIDALASSFEGNRKAAAHALDSVIDTITREVARGEKVAITGFGSFEKRVREARLVRNPRTGESLMADRIAIPRFSPGANLKSVVAGLRELPQIALDTATAAIPGVKATTLSGVAKAAHAGDQTSEPEPLIKPTSTERAPTSSPGKQVAAGAAPVKTAAKKAPAKKVAAKKVAAKRSPAQQAVASASPAPAAGASTTSPAQALAAGTTSAGTPATKTVARKSPATKSTASTSPAKTSPAKTSPAKTSPAKKATVKKATAKKTAAKKTTAKKTTAKQTIAKKTTAKKTTAKKTTAKKTTAKKTAGQD